MNKIELKGNKNEQKGKLNAKFPVLTDEDLQNEKGKKSEIKTSRLNTITKNFLLGVIIIMIVFSFNSCATKAAFLISSVVPAARGYVKVKKDNNNNYTIKVHLYNLAEVKRLQPSKHTYVVWLVSEQEISSNIGQVNSSTSLISKKLSGYFETVSSFKPAKIFITAENDESVQSPGDMVVLSTDRF